MRLAGPAAAELQRLNKAKRYCVARNPIHGYVVNQELTSCIMSFMILAGGLDRSTTVLHNELQPISGPGFKDW